jgi:hypothetical protein
MFKAIRIRCITAWIGLCLCAAGLAAQELPLGLWSGQLTLPGDGGNISFEITLGRRASGALSAKMRTSDNEFALTNVSFESGKLAFTFEPSDETVAQCELKAQDAADAYVGRCPTADNAGTLKIRMIPPPEQAAEAEEPSE